MGTNPKTTPLGHNPTNTPRSQEQGEAVVGGENAGHMSANITLVVGQLVGTPELRTLPSGTTAFSFSLTVRVPGERATSVPVVWYDPPKRVLRWAAGDGVVVQGAIVRRFFRGGSGLGSSTEVVVERGELTRHQGKADAVRQRTKSLLTTTETSG